MNTKTEKNKLDLAIEQHKQGNLEEAKEVYNEILLEEAENADVRYLLATLQLSENQLDKALENINKCIEDNNNAPAFYQLKGSILARLGQVEEALETLKIALKENPNLFQSHIAVGHLYYEKGNKKEAEKHFNMAKKINSNSPEAHVNLAKIYMDDGEIKKAINLLRNVEQQHPDQAPVKMMMGQAFIENGAYNFAENYFQKVLAMHPEYSLAGLYLGITKLYTGDMKNAEHLITLFNKEYPNTREGTAAMGLLFFKKGNFTIAAEHLNNAIGNGLAPMSWKASFVESMARLGHYHSAIEFYKELEKTKKDKTAIYRLGELYELQGHSKKARKQYKQIEENDNKYIAALLGISRSYLAEEKFEKAEKAAKKVLQRNSKHAEATLLLLTSLLQQEKQEEALTILKEINYQNYNDVYKKAFRLQHGLILDKQEKYKKAMKVFKDPSKREKSERPVSIKLKEEEIAKIKAFETKIEDTRKDPVFVIGSQATAINQFVIWLYKHKLTVLNDRLITAGRADILHIFKDIDTLAEADDAMVRLERKIYHQKAKALTRNLDEKVQLVDCMYINPAQAAIIKKFFPQASVILLNRSKKDLKLNENVFDQEPITADEWDEAKDQIKNMGLNLTVVNADKWMDNDKETLKKLSKIFDKELQPHEENKQNYWQKIYFPKGHWKNYKDYM